MEKRLQIAVDVGSSYGQYARVFIEYDVHIGFPPAPECRDSLAQADQQLDQFPQLFVLALSVQLKVDFRLLECFVRLRIGYVALPAEVGELITAAFADGLDQLRVGMADEVEKRRCLPLLLAHEQQGNIGRQQHQARRELLFLEGH